MTAEEQLGRFIAKFTPEIAALAESALAKMRKRFPTALQLVYDNYNALAIGFGPTERPSDAIFSIALYPKRVSLCFLQGGEALAAAKVPFGPSGAGRLIIKSVSAKQRPRRPA